MQLFLETERLLYLNSPRRSFLLPLPLSAPTIRTKTAYRRCRHYASTRPCTTR